MPTGYTMNRSPLSHMLEVRASCIQTRCTPPACPVPMSLQSQTRPGCRGTLSHPRQKSTVERSRPSSPMPSLWACLSYHICKIHREPLGPFVVPTRVLCGLQSEPPHTPGFSVQPPVTFP